MPSPLLRSIVGAFVVASTTLLVLLLLSADPRTVRHERAVIFGSSLHSAAVADANAFSSPEPAAIELPLAHPTTSEFMHPNQPFHGQTRSGDDTRQDAASLPGIDPATTLELEDVPAATRSLVAPRIRTTEATPVADTDPFVAVIESARSGVFRIETVRCLGGRQGTGFQIGRGLVATAAHVVAEARVVTVHVGAQDLKGEVIGYDNTTDLALVRLDHPQEADAIGHVFAATETVPEVGDGVLALGFPRTKGLTASTGDVIAIHHDVVIGAPSRQDYLETSAQLVPGNSGGPVLDESGQVLGLAVSVLADDKTKSFAVLGDEAWATFDRWIDRPSPPPRATCEASASE